jgi:hypothetical protein
MKPMRTNSLTRMAQALFYFNAALWLMLGIAGLVRAGGGSPYTAWIVTVLMFGNAAALALCGWGIGIGQKGYLYLSLAVLGVNILLTFTDQVGALDIATLAIDVILLGLLIGIWKRKAI